MGHLLKQSSTAHPLVFLLVLSSDHITGATGLTPTVTLSKEGAAFASPAGAVTEIGNGWYKVAGNATDTNTLGSLILHASGTGTDPVDDVYRVVAFDPDDANGLGLSRLDAAVSSRMATFTLPTNFASLAITGGGAVTAGTVSDKTGYTLTQSFPTNFATLSIDGSGRALLQPAQPGVTIPTVTTVTNQLTAAQIATGVWQDATAGDFTTVGSIGKSLFTSGNAPGAANGLALVGSNMGTVSSVTGSVGSVTGSVAAVTGSVGSVTGNVGGNVVGSVGSVTAGVTVTTNNDKTGYSLANGSIVTATFGTCDFTTTMKASLNAATPASIQGNVGGNVTGTVGGFATTPQVDLINAPNATALTAVANAILDLASAIDPTGGADTVRKALRLITASTAGKLSGAGTTSVVIKDTTGAKSRITATVDSSGNRTATTYDLT